MKACSSKVGSWATLYESTLLMLAHNDRFESSLLTTTDGGDEQLPTLTNTSGVTTGEHEYELTSRENVHTSLVNLE